MYITYDVCMMNIVKTIATLILYQVQILVCAQILKAVVAQLARAPSFQVGCCRFEPCLPHQFQQDIAQSGSALALEVSGRWFKSNYPDQFTTKEVGLEAAIYNE